MYKIDAGDALQELITDIKALRQKGDHEGIIRCLDEMTENPAPIRASMPKFDVDEVLLYVDEQLTVYYIATTPRILYPAHEHGMVAISALYKGTETHVFYDPDGENVVERSRVRFKSPAVVDMTVPTIHAICNDDDVPNESLHFYLGDLETQKRRMWDQDGKNPQQYIHENYLSFSRPY